MVQKQKPSNHRTFARINVRYYPVRSEKFDNGAVGLIDETLVGNVEHRWTKLVRMTTDSMVTQPSHHASLFTRDL